MYLREATHKLLLELDRPIITEYDLFILTTNLLINGSFQGELIRRTPREWDVYRCRALIRNLMRDRVLVPDDDFRSGVWRLVQSSTAGSTEEVCCLVDPFCYVSHLSAMYFHGLIGDVVPEVHFTTPDRTAWRALRDIKTAEDFTGNSPPFSVPILTRIGFKPRVRKREVAVHETKFPARTVPMGSTEARVAAAGQVFAGMLEDPRLCGGMRYVVQVWNAQAQKFLDEIIDAVDEHTSKIVRVRAGYLIEEQLGVRDLRVARWQNDAQRGGSRRLDPDEPYAPVFSERWMLSLNI